MTDWTRFVPAGPSASPEATPYSGVTVTDYFRREGLLRPKEGRWLAGVCAGLGRRYGMSAAKARLLFVLVLMIVPGSQILVYPLLWILMPEE